MIPKHFHGKGDVLTIPLPGKDQADKHHKGDNRFGKIAFCQPVDLCWQEEVLGDVHKKAGKTHRLNREQSPKYRSF